MKTNKKGFTLIELLAVIVILGILMMTAIPAVTRAIAKSRRNTYWQNMKSYAKSAATPFLDGEYSGTLADGSTTDSCPYPGVGEYVVIPVDQVELEQGDSKKSSFKSGYVTTNTACKPTIVVANVGTIDATTGVTKDNLQWYVIGLDQAKNGITEYTNINNLNLNSVKTGATCSSSAVNVNVGTISSTNKPANMSLKDENGTAHTVAFKATCAK